MYGIDGLLPREPIGAAVTIGVKGERGFPVEKDRFHIAIPAQDADGRRPHHPAFAAFNAAAPEKRRIIRGNLVHASQAECFEHHLKAQVLSKAHPDKRPACVGDGITAERWEGPEPDNMMQIKCPNERCEYRLSTPPKCKPWMRFLFRLRWSDGVALPTPLVKFTSGSWRTTANLLGFFEYLERTAKQLGIKPNLFGVPFVLTLTEQTKASERTRFPVVTITPELDPIDFWAAQSQRLESIKPLPALTDDTEQSAAVQFSDLQTIIGKP